ncbi:putative Hemerythrin-like metal-binding protein [Rubrivivax sp. A210]|uniref:bacteriohemerythrin n=1 Tax=Rubrivivax sp. A210 TaxID=2772301 RepID=UPI00191A85E4|nr:hemerythrin family protein [Rubrivivax sp. A210]CAD5374781.1 putative Hemerythrin-like metal-binding protein [Rubrivivax sp. A210]
MFINKHKPAWLYESLPYIYLTTGAGTMFAVRDFIGAFSGLMLATAGGWVWRMRHVYRRRAKGKPGVEGKTLVKLRWRASFEVGQATIDAQHRALFATANRLMHAILTDKPRLATARLFQKLVTDVEEHFKTEERLMQDSGRPLSEAHKSDHALLLSKVAAMQARFAGDAVQSDESIGFVACNLIAEHVVAEHRELRLL